MTVVLKVMIFKISLIIMISSIICMMISMTFVTITIEKLNLNLKLNLRWDSAPGWMHQIQIDIVYYGVNKDIIQNINSD